MRCSLYLTTSYIWNPKFVKKSAQHLVKEYSEKADQMKVPILSVHARTERERGREPVHNLDSNKSECAS
jgi:tRNA-dihydrouridine synthase